MSRGISVGAVFFAISCLCLTARARQVSQIPAPNPPVKVVLVGDSTVALQGGWGPGFCAHLIASAQCLDLAANGRSTKSYIDEGLWAKALQTHGQFYFIQFGHNDQKHRPALFTDPQTSFQANLDRFVRDVRRIGGTPVLVTSLSRRNYRNGKLIVDPLRDYAAATRQVAAKDRVPHLNTLGKKTFGDMVAHAAWKNVPALRPYLLFRAAKKQASSPGPLRPSAPARHTPFPVSMAMM